MATLSQKTDEIAALESLKKDLAKFEMKQAKATKADVKVKIAAKIKGLREQIKAGKTKGKDVSAKQLANSLLRSRKKFLEMSKKDFNGVIRQLSKKPEYSFLKGMSRTEVINDINRKAKPVGWRFKGRGNYKTPTKEQVRKGRKDGSVYYENRPNRSDVSQARQLAKGGSTYAEGGEITEFTTIKELNEYKSLDSERKTKKITNPFKGIILSDNAEQIEYYFEEVSPNKYKFAFDEEFEEFDLDFKKGGSTYGEGGEIKTNQLEKRILSFLRGKNGGWHFTTIADFFGMTSENNSNKLFETLKDLEKKGFVKKGLNWEQTVKGRKYIDSIPYASYSEGGKVRVIKDISNRSYKDNPKKGDILIVKDLQKDINYFETEEKNVPESVTAYFKGRGNEYMLGEEVEFIEMAKGGSTYAEGGENHSDIYKIKPNYSPIKETEDYYEMDSYVKVFYGDGISGTDIFLESEEVDGIYPINVDGERTMDKDEGYVVKKGKKYVFMIPTYAEGGELKPVPNDNKGLPKLPKEVRNRMGYMAKGGSLKGHGLAIGDEIVNVYRDDIYVLNRGVVYMVDLSSGKRTMTKMNKDDAISTFKDGGEVKEDPQVVRYYFEDDGYEYAEGGEVDINDIEIPVHYTMFEEEMYEYGKGGNTEQKYLVKRVFKDGSKSRIVDENLSEKEAQEMVQEDIENNPKAEYYMLVYTKMN